MLTIIGTGIQAAGQLTIEAQSCVQQADKLLYLVADAVTKQLLHQLNATAESIEDCYADGKDRFQSYLEMIERILNPVRQGLDVCVAFYGHPGVFVYPSHEAIRLARLEGYVARMLPGISAEDCLFADLGVDPALTGCQSFETTDFLIHRRKFDTSCSLVLWQVGVIGDVTFRSKGYSNDNLRVIVEYLEEFYDKSHNVFIYEASHYPIYNARLEKLPLHDLAKASLTPISTLYVPPNHTAPIDDDMLKRLGMARKQLHPVKLNL